MRAPASRATRLSRWLIAALVVGVCTMLAGMVFAVLTTTYDLTAGQASGFGTAYVGGTIFAVRQVMRDATFRPRRAQEGADQRRIAEADRSIRSPGAKRR